MPRPIFYSSGIEDGKVLEWDVIMHLMRRHDFRNRFDAVVPDFRYSDCEADLICIPRQSSYCHEFEIKACRYSFAREKRKVTEIEGVKKRKTEAMLAGEMLPNYFWYVLCDGVARESEIDEKFGLIVFYPDRKLVVTKRMPARLHDGRLSDNYKFKIARVACRKWWAMHLRGYFD